MTSIRSRFSDGYASQKQKHVNFTDWKVAAKM